MIGGFRKYHHKSVKFSVIFLFAINLADSCEVGNNINNAVSLLQEKLYEMYYSCCPIQKKNVSRNRYFNRGLWITMTNASIQNIGYFINSKLDWYHLKITLDTKPLLLRCWGKQRRVISRINLIMLLVIQERLGTC